MSLNRHTDPKETADKLLAGSERALAIVLRWIDDRSPNARLALETLQQHASGGFRLGVTGAPGAGKSTLVDALISAYRRDEKRVGVLAVDPSSPFSGGAILGDRIRMGERSEDPGVFIRSLATRGAMGGLSRSTADSVKAISAAGYDLTIIETVGTGQDEVDIMRLADTTALVLTPEAGDDVQAIKAGLMEIADILVVNKSDREGADRFVTDLQQMLSLRDEVAGEKGWRPPIIQTVARLGRGIEDLIEAVGLHRRWLAMSGEGKKRARSRQENELQSLVLEEIGGKIVEDLKQEGTWEGMISDLMAHKVDPYLLAERIRDRYLK